MSEVWYAAYDKDGFISSKSTQLERAYEMAERHTSGNEEILFVFSEQDRGYEEWVIGESNTNRQLLALVYQGVVFKRKETSEEGEK